MGGRVKQKVGESEEEMRKGGGGVKGKGVCCSNSVKKNEHFLCLGEVTMELGKKTVNPGEEGVKKS